MEYHKREEMQIAWFGMSNQVHNEGYVQNKCIVSKLINFFFCFKRCLCVYLCYVMKILPPFNFNLVPNSNSNKLKLKLKLELELDQTQTQLRLKLKLSLFDVFLALHFCQLIE